MSGRLRSETLDRLVKYAAEVLALVEELETARRPRRVIDQLTGSGTSAPAQLFEASEAISKADFVKCLSWGAKEFSETLFWLRVMERRAWLPSDRLAWLLAETIELLKITKTLIARVRQSSKQPPI